MLKVKTVNKLNWKHEQRISTKIGIIFLENQILWLKNEKLTGGLTTLEQKNQESQSTEVIWSQENKKF